MLRALPGVRCLMPDTENEQQPIAEYSMSDTRHAGVGNPYTV